MWKLYPEKFFLEAYKYPNYTKESKVSKND